MELQVSTPCGGGIGSYRSKVSAVPHRPSPAGEYNILRSRVGRQYQTAKLTGLPTMPTTWAQFDLLDYLATPIPLLANEGDVCLPTSRQSCLSAPV